MTTTRRRRNFAPWSLLAAVLAAAGALIFVGMLAVRDTISIARTASVTGMTPAGTPVPSGSPVPSADPVPSVGPLPGSGPTPGAATPSPSGARPLPPGLTVHEPPAGAPAADTARYAGRTGVFGLAAPGRVPGRVFFATAVPNQPAGPETLRPADVARYVEVTLARGASVMVTTPIAEQGVTNYVRGIAVSPARFGVLYRAMVAFPGMPVLDRAHMFRLTFDARGDVTGMRQIFSP